MRFFFQNFFALHLGLATLSAAAAVLGVWASESAAAETGASSSSKPEAVPPKILRYAGRLLKQFDANGNGRLEPGEWQRMPGEVRQADADGDGVITLEELSAWMADYSRRHRIRLLLPLQTETELPSLFKPATAKAGGIELQRREATQTRPEEGQEAKATGAELEAAGAKKPAPDRPKSDRTREGAKFHVGASRLPPGLPQWFLDRDLDGDGQLTLGEFAPNPTPQLLEEFRRYDLNGDGLITANECLRALGIGKKKAPSDKTTDEKGKNGPAGDGR